MSKIMSSVNKYSFTISFPHACLLFSCRFPLIELSNTNITLCRRGKNECPCFVADLRGKASSLSPLNVVWVFQRCLLL